MCGVVSSGHRAAGAEPPQGPSPSLGPFLAEASATFLACLLGELRDRNQGTAHAHLPSGGGTPPDPGSVPHWCHLQTALQHRGAQSCSDWGGGLQAPPSPSCLCPRDHGFLQGRLSLLTLALTPRHFREATRSHAWELPRGLLGRPGPPRASPTFCPGGPL